MPVRNEAGFIAKTLEGLFAQDYPRDRLELIVADGMSDDGTREILADLCRQHAHLVVIDNPGRIVSTGLNAAIAKARGDIIVRIDGHAEIATDFIRQDVKLLEEHPEAWVVGGPINHAGRNAFGQAVAVAMSHPAGVGLATHRFPNYEGYVEGAQFPALRRWVFERVGNFDEHLVRNQDDEMNFRINQAGGKSYVSPRVKYIYYVRDTPRKLFKQYLQYSFWRIPVIRKHKRPTTPRQMVPLLFFLAMLVLLMLGIALRQPLVALALPALYTGVLVMIGISQIPKVGLSVAWRVPIAIATMHVAYALGMAVGFFSAIFRPRAWDHGGSMATLSR